MARIWELGVVRAMGGPLGIGRQGPGGGAPADWWVGQAGMAPRSRSGLVENRANGNIWADI